MDLPGNDALRKVMEKLHGCAVGEYIQLPDIAVMGDTSSGKSSLLSSIAMIELPKNNTLTTRCPIRLIMRQKNERKARVSIQWKSDAPEAIFHPRDIPENQLDTLSDNITEAQTFLLKQRNNAQVSSDVIVVEISSPAFVDLTLTDLPGIVRSTSQDESDKLIEEIRDLMKQYLENPRCVILAVHPANVDFHNSEIMSYAKKVDPNTTRTIPVITKPDLIDSGAESDVLSLLMGEKMEFSKGFHMTKGRGQNSLDANQSIEDSIKAETQFFQEKQPWKDVEDRTKFGIVHLRHKLGNLQLNMIREFIPQIIEEVENKQIKADKSLGMMREHLESQLQRYQRFMLIVERYKEYLTACMSGKRLQDKDHKNLAVEKHKLFSAFQEALHGGTLMRIGTLCEGANVVAFDTNTSTEVFGKLVYVDDDIGVIDSLSKNNMAERDLVNNNDMTYYTVDGELMNIRHYSGEEEEIVKGYYEAKWNSGARKPKVYKFDQTRTAHLLKDVPRKNIKTDPVWLKQEIEEHRTDDIVCFLNADIFNSLVQNFISKQWEPLCHKLLDDVASLIKTVLTDHEAALQFPEASTLIRNTSLSVLSKVIEANRKNIQDYITLESKPYTQNHYLFENMSKMRTQRLKEKVLCLFRNDPDQEYSGPEIIKTINAVFEQNERTSLDDHMAEELEFILGAYGKVAFKRFMDIIPQIVSRMTKQFVVEVEQTLRTTAEENIEQVMQEDPGQHEKRRQLQKEIEDLKKGKVILCEL